MTESIRLWLESLGLDIYAEAFEENDLDVELAADLTDADLKDLGVASMGHRKKLLRAIEALAAAPTAIESAPSTMESSPEPSEAATGQAELPCWLRSVVRTRSVPDPLIPEQGTLEHWSADVRFRADFVRSTSSSRHSGQGWECLKLTQAVVKTNF